MRATPLAIAALLLAGCAEAQRGPRTETVRIGGRQFTLETALDTAARTRGLMARQEITPDGGMLFIFPDAQVRSFWMGYCLVDIDVIFLDPRGRVTALHEMKVEPPRRSDESEAAYRARLANYSSVFPAQFAIELRGGTLDELDLHVEDRIDLDLERLKALAR